jgi:Rho termination factor, N-terminal domain
VIRADARFQREYPRVRGVSSPSLPRALIVPSEEAKEEIMPRGRGSNSLKNPKLYEELREDGASKEKAARISNAVARDGQKAVARRGGTSGDYEDWTVARLRTRAKELGITGYSGKRKSELITMLREH